MIKMGRIEKKYNLTKIAEHLKIDRKELYNLSKKNFYLSEVKILSVIFLYEDKKELEKKFTNFKNREAIKITNVDKKYEAEIKFLEKTKAEAGVDTLSDGILYKVIKEGKGEKPSETSMVRVNYKGSLIGGKVFDESKAPIEFALNRVIKGWGIALQAMPVGSKWTIYIPSNLAYGVRGAGDAIGPNETLVFDVELLAIVKKDEAKK